MAFWRKPETQAVLPVSVGPDPALTEARAEVGRLAAEVARLQAALADADDRAERAEAEGLDLRDALTEARSEGERIVREAQGQISDLRAELGGLKATTAAVLAKLREGVSIVDQTLANLDAATQRTTNSTRVLEALQNSADTYGRVNQVIGAIKQIAGQTKMLALNAAIEAARAGEHGRGFSIVADEVGKLARDTGSATADISTMIERLQSGTNEAVTTLTGSLLEMDSGADLAFQVGMVLNDMETQMTTADEALTALQSRLS